MNTKNLVWIDLNTQTTIPKALKPWLIDDKSLTHKLRQAFDDFSVEVLSQKVAAPYTNELDVLNCDTKVIVREVNLLGNYQAVVFARSVIPITSDTQDLFSIGDKPLGEILFNDNNIKRGKMQITHTGNIWGRRSTFTIGQTKLLVSEFFLEVFMRDKIFSKTTDLINFTFDKNVC